MRLERDETTREQGGDRRTVGTGGKRKGSNSQVKEEIVEAFLRDAVMETDWRETGRFYFRNYSPLRAYFAFCHVETPTLRGESARHIVPLPSAENACLNLQSATFH